MCLRQLVVRYFYLNWLLFICVCARVCVCVCMFMWLEDTYVYNDMGITQVLQGDGDLFFGHFQCPHN